MSVGNEEENKCACVGVIFFESRFLNTFFFLLVQVKKRTKFERDVWEREENLMGKIKNFSQNFPFSNDKNLCRWECIKNTF